MGVLIPLFFSTSGGMGRAATTTYKHLARLLSEKWNSPCSAVMGWLRCSLGFFLLRSSVMCIRGSRSRSKCPCVPPAVDLAVAEGEGSPTASKSRTPPVKSCPEIRNLMLLS